MPDHGADAAHEPALEPAAQRADDLFLRQIEPRERTRLERQPGGDAGGEPPLRLAQRGNRPRSRLARHRVGREIEPEIDVEFLEQRQPQYRQPGLLLDACERPAQGRVRGRRGHEPEVVAVLALVVVVHAQVAAHLPRHRVQPLGRHRHRREGARADRIGAEHGCDAVDQPARLELPEAGDHVVFVEPARLRDLGEGPRRERKIALPGVEEAEARGVEHLRIPSSRRAR